MQESLYSRWHTFRFLVLASVAVLMPRLSLADTDALEGLAIDRTKVLAPETIANSLLQDWNGDGHLSIIAFGDSMTRGTGDSYAAGAYVEDAGQPKKEAGYPLRIEKFLGVPVSNYGVAGEILTDDAIFRFASMIKQGRPDVVILSEGSNDAGLKTPANKVFRSLQTMINLAVANNAKVILATIPPSCCIHDGLDLFTNSYNSQYYALVAANELPLADSNKAFLNNCGQPEDCYLLNLPEGLHPNRDGYDVIGEVVSGALLKFDILSQSQAALFEKALGLAPGSLRTAPNPI